MKVTFDRIKKYNPWDGINFNLGYERTAYLDKISDFTGNKLIKVIIGQRRTGKSYLMRQIINKLISNDHINPKNIFYLNKEYTAFDDISTAVDLENLFSYYIEQLNVQGKVFIFLDEIQNINNWETFVNSYSQDFTREYEIFISGSNSKLLSGELATLLSGRYVEFEVFPYSLSEFAGINNQIINRGVFLNFVQTSGLPEMMNFNNEEVRGHYIGDLKNTIVLRDIVQRNNVKDINLLEDIFKFLSLNIGNLTSFTGIVKYFESKQKRTNYETISTYVQYLVDTFILHEAGRFNIKGKQALAGVRKYYLNDLAFKNYIFGYNPSDIGYHLENFVYLQLKQLGYHISIGVINGNEIDFIAQKTNKTKYIQVSYLLNETSMEREFENLLSIKDNHEKIVISLDDIKFSDYQGIRHLRPWELTE